MFGFVRMHVFFPQAGQFPPAALNQMIGGLVGQLLTGATGQMGIFNNCTGDNTCPVFCEVNNIMSSLFNNRRVRSQSSLVFST